MTPSNENVSSLMKNFLYDEVFKFYSVENPLVPCYIISKDEIKSNIITDNYLFDYISDSTFQNNNKEIYPSDIHNYLQLNPFLNLLVELFNDTISKNINTTHNNKRVIL